MSRTPLEQQLIAEAWGALAGEQPPPVDLHVGGATGHLPSRFAVEETAVACVGTALLAAAALHRQHGASCEWVGLDRGHVSDAVRSERFFRHGDQHGGATFATLSRFWPADDGWVRTHANYPWHKAALLRALGTSEDVEAVAAAVARLAAEEVEVRVVAAGGIAAAVRPIDLWRAHPQGQAAAAEALVGRETVGDAAPRVRAIGDMPATGVRVLDFTRVIAGPVATRFLAALGANVLRVDPPHHLDMAVGEVGDTLLGKRSALLDLRESDGDALHRLLDKADVVVCGYRPGSLDRFGLSPPQLAERHPGLVIVLLDAWGHAGPWAARRGFDSIVQAATGIAAHEGSAEPGVLPCQLLDHGTGYLAAAAVLDGLRRQGTEGGTWVRRLSLAATAMWLTSTATVATTPTALLAAHSPAPPWLVEVPGSLPPVTAVAPPGTIDDQSLRWPPPPTAYGADPATW